MFGLCPLFKFIMITQNRSYVSGGIGIDGTHAKQLLFVQARRVRSRIREGDNASTSLPF